MILFPPSAAVTVVIDGAPVSTYEPAFVRNGRTYAPIRPFFTRTADCVRLAGRILSVERDGRIVRFRFSQAPSAVPYAYVPLAPMMRGLGASVTYFAHHVIVRFPHTAVAVPTPFNSTLPQVSPHAVFTPEPVATPRPRWSGNPLPRRTPIPATAPTPARTPP